MFIFRDAVVRFSVTTVGFYLLSIDNKNNINIELFKVGEEDEFKNNYRT
jgi:hypothetical protein